MFPLPILSASESQGYGLRFVRSSSIPDSLTRHELWKALWSTQADVCRLNIRADQAQDIFLHLQAIGIPYSLFGVLFRAVMRVSTQIPENLPEPLAHYRPSTPADYDRLYHVAKIVAPDVLPYQFTDPLADFLLPLEQRVELQARYIASFATAPPEEKRVALLMEINQEIVGYTTLEFSDVHVTSGFGGVLPEYRNLGLMRDMNPYQTRYVQAQGPQYRSHWYDTHIQNSAMMKATMHYGMNPEYSVLNLNLMPLWQLSALPPQEGPWNGQPLTLLWETIAPAALAAADIDINHTWLEQQRQQYAPRLGASNNLSGGRYRLSWPVRTEQLAIAFLSATTADGQPAATLYIRFVPAALAA